MSITVGELKTLLAGIADDVTVELMIGGKVTNYEVNTGAGSSVVITPIEGAPPPTGQP
jgi:hypothetical protein